jgi:hypothetical protein
MGFDDDDEEISLEGAIAVMAKVLGCTPQQAADELLRMWRDGYMPVMAREVARKDH